jgi:hypothetical protein
LVIIQTKGKGYFGQQQEQDEGQKGCSNPSRAGEEIPGAISKKENEVK